MVFLCVVCNQRMLYCMDLVLSTMLSTIIGFAGVLCLVMSIVTMVQSYNIQDWPLAFIAHLQDMVLLQLNI